MRIGTQQSKAIPQNMSKTKTLRRSNLGIPPVVFTVRLDYITAFLKNAAFTPRLYSTTTRTRAKMAPLLRTLHETSAPRTSLTVRSNAPRHACPGLLHSSHPARQLSG